MAVDALHSDNVDVARPDRVGTGDIYTVHVRRSTDRGATWSSDLRTLTNATDASLAVSTNGTVGLLYQQVTGPAGASRWVTRLEQSRDGFATHEDLVLATVPAATPPFQFLPYIGDYNGLLTRGNQFLGIFSANNTPDSANFPQGVVYQRRVDFTTHRLLDGSGAPVALTAGDSVTVETARAGSLKAGIQATFYTTGWIFGRGVAVREVGHEPGQSPVVTADAREAVARARAVVNDADLKAHIQRAAMVVAGRVEQVRPAELTAAPTRPRRITEHDPDWQEAIIQVEDGIKGAKAGEQVVVRFPGSRDVAWVGTPRFAVGQEGTFVLHKDSTTGSPLTMLAGQAVPAYTALQQVDVLSPPDP